MGKTYKKQKIYKNFRYPRSSKKAKIYKTRNKAIPPSEYEDIIPDEQCFLYLKIIDRMKSRQIPKRLIINAVHRRFKIPIKIIESIINN